MRILFLCVANSARSQMAEALARHRLGTKHEFFSAGSKPTEVHPMAIEVMREIGIDISHQKSKSIDTIDFSKIEAVVTLCAEEVCPTIPKKTKRLHWSLPDPARLDMSKTSRISKSSLTGQLDEFRKIRDKISEFLETFDI